MSTHTTTTTTGRAKRWLSIIVGVAALVPRVLHELSHALVGAPFAHQVSVTFSVDDTTAWCDVEFRESAPSWGVWLAFLAPFVLGVGFLTAAATYAATRGVPLPADVEGWLWASILGLWWTIYAYPSRQDRQGARDVTSALNAGDDGGEAGS